ncbi:hypothetical protein JQC91_14990 [Jannaschia sp. Os4]|uniref:hypothetical protein n=1 Tax=Jannaschia sp. Os4 TaxID=2807617 RepID=UPI00193A2447|nr:hypothetical protein [Jannaschia sp. Os4]MBM2577611.1 hypothetical protein [Jannaschia sp. Os4]
MSARDPFRGMAPAASAAQRRAQDRARRTDAARLLPLLGAVLLIAPDLVLSGRGAGATAPGLVYLFAAWAGVIALAALIARAVNRDRDPAPGGPGAGEGEGG